MKEGRTFTCSLQEMLGELYAQLVYVSRIKYSPIELSMQTDGKAKFTPAVIADYR